MKDVSTEDVLFGVRIEKEKLEQLKEIVNQDMISDSGNEILIQISEDKYVFFYP